MARRPLPPERRALIRRVQLMVVAGGVSASYLAAAGCVLVFDGGAGAALLLHDQLCLRTAFHGLLVVGVSGLYVSTRSRVWLLLAWLYLLSTSAHVTAVGCLSLAAGPPTVAVCAAAASALNLLLLTTFVRYRLLATSGDDDWLPAVPWNGSYTRRDAVAYASVALVFVLKHIAVAAEVAAADAAATPWDGLSFVPWLYLLLSANAMGGHAAVSACLGLFAIMKSLPHAAWAYALVAGGASYAEAAAYLGPAPRSPWDHAAFVCQLASCALVLWAAGRSEATESPPPPPPHAPEDDDVDRDEPTMVLSQAGQRIVRGGCWMHAVAWYVEALFIVAACGDDAPCGAIEGTVAAGVGGVHSAILLGVQLMHTDALADVGVRGSRDHLRRRAFHLVAGGFYLVVATAAVLGRLVHGAAGGAAALLLCMAAVRCVAAGAVLLVTTPCKTDSWRFQPRAAERLEGDDPDASGSTLSADAPDSVDRVMAVYQRTTAYCVAGVAVCISLLIAAMALASDANSEAQGSPNLPGALAAWHTMAGHSPAHALSFHFTFLYAVHVLVGAYYYRRVSIAFIRLGTLFVIPLLGLAALGVARGGGSSGALVAGLLSILAGAAAATAWSIGRVNALCRAYPQRYEGGNVPWK